MEEEPQSEANDPRQRWIETKRRRRESIAVAVAALVLVAFTLAQTSFPEVSYRTSLMSNLAVILLFDLSFLLLGLLLFLVGRNLAKVIFERRRGLIGSRLQARLVAGFIAVAIVPSAFLLYVSESFLRADIESWFSPAYERVLDDSLDIAKTYYLNSANDAVHYARVIAQQAASRKLLDPARRNDLKQFVAEKQQEYSLGTVEVFGSDRSLLVLALSPNTPTGVGVAPDSSLIARTLTGHADTRTDQFGKSDVIRGTAPIFATSDSDKVLGVIVVDYFLPRSVAKRAGSISHTFQQYLQLRILKQPILRSYILVLLLIGLVVVLLASWFGLFLARGITVPIKRLAAGTREVAAGNLTYQIPPVGDDEIGQLVESFNQMTTDLRDSAAELERRRYYTETLVRNVSAGVVALDREGRVTTVNPCAERLLGISSSEAIANHYKVAFPPEVARVLDEVVVPEDRAGVGHPRPGETTHTMSLDVGSGGTEIMMTASPLGDDVQGNLGTVIFFEDVSQLAKVERMEVWREVARRIAHEIKNPLTPIQLSADRIRRQFAGTGNGGALIEECTRTIISEVEGLKHLVNEFAAFARMPQLTLIPGNLNSLAEEVAALFREGNDQIEFVVELDPAMPRVALDHDSLKRAIVNLIDNGIAAATGSTLNGCKPRLELVTRFSHRAGVATLEVADNGPGIDPRLRARIFEPYFSTKQGGTGLGLAIVSTIVADHHGFIRVRDNLPRGSRFFLEFPVMLTQNFGNLSGNHSGSLNHEAAVRNEVKRGRDYSGGG
jgi:two-component system nitrogen regulation sensor histidine kinase NtrY